MLAFVKTNLTEPIVSINTERKLIRRTNEIYKLFLLRGRKNTPKLQLIFFQSSKYRDSVKKQHETELILQGTINRLPILFQPTAQTYNTQNPEYASGRR